jgi:hypothetical protein
MTHKICFEVLDKKIIKKSHVYLYFVTHKAGLKILYERGLLSSLDKSRVFSLCRLTKRASYLKMKRRVVPELEGITRVTCDIFLPIKCAWIFYKRKCMRTYQ